MLELKRRELKLNLYGDEISLRFPSVKTIEDFTIKSIKAAKGETDLNDVSLSKELVVSCGMDREKAEELDYEDLITITRTLTGLNEKKN
jgi:hypothetical protein